MAQKTEPHDGAQGSGQRDDNTPTDTPATTKSQRTKYVRKVQATPIYCSLLSPIRRRMVEKDFTFARLDDRSGLNDGHSAHCFAPDSPSGRQARWETLQLIIEALWPGGVVITIDPAKPDPLSALSDRTVTREMVHWRLSQHFKTLGSLGGKATVERHGQGRQGKAWLRERGRKGAAVANAKRRAAIEQETQS